MRKIGMNGQLYEYYIWKSFKSEIKNEKMTIIKINIKVKYKKKERK